ncbi:MAG: aspartate/glutamate racemase family protein, partial [Alistipes sp.]|nr:aspartate/glutamate racemase family protein [Alistipes sp.]
EKEQRAEALALRRNLLQPMLERGADRIVLGCTHYPFLLDTLRRAAAGYEVEFVDPSPAVARRVVQLLDENNLHADPTHQPRYDFITFADAAYAERLRRKAFGNK